MTKERSAIWDFLKGIAILTVLFGHAQGGWNFILWAFYVPVDSLNFNSWFVIRLLVGAFLPLFFFIAGYCISNRYESAMLYYQTRVKRIVIPFFIWSGVYTLANVLIYHLNVTFLSFLLGTNGIQLYFLVVMIQLMLLTPIMKAIKNKKLMLVISFIITLANNICHLKYWINNDQIMSNEMILFTCFIAYYTLGYYVKINIDIAKLNTPKMRTTSITLLVLSYVLLLTSSYILLHLTNDATVAISFNSPFNIFYSMSFIFFVLSFRDLYVSGPLEKKIEWIGQNSMDFFAVHWLFMYPMELWELKNIPAQYMWLTNITMVVATFLCSYCFVILKQKFLKSFLRRIK